MPAIVRSISAGIFCFLFAVAAAKAADDDWLTYRHDSQRTGNQLVKSDLSDPAKISGLHIVGRFPPDGSRIKIPGGFKASPIVVDGMVFIGGVDGYFYALDAASGALIWQYPKATDPPLLGSSASCPKTDTGYGGYGTYGVATGATFAVIGGQKAVIFGAPDPTAPPLDPTGHGFGSARLFAFPLSGPLPAPNKPWIWESDVVAKVTGCTSAKVDVKKSLGELHERIAYSSPLVLGDTVYVGIHDTGDSPIQQGRVVAVDLNTGHLTGFQFLGAGTTPGDLNNRGGGVWNALATDGTAVYFTTGNGRLPWCVWPYTNCAPNYAPPGKEPQPNNGLSMIRVNKDTGTIDWKFNTVDFNHDGDPDWAAGAAVMSASCGKLIASVQKDGWAYAVDADSADPRGTMRWQFPPTIESEGLAGFLNDVHGDDDYRRPGAVWNDVFILRTGGEDVVADGVEYNYYRLHALNACATAEQDRVRWIADIPSQMTSDLHIGFSSPTVTGGIVFIGTYQNPNDSSGHLVVLADPTVAPGSVGQQICSNPGMALGACKAPYPYAPVPSLQPLADLPMPDGGSLASMRNEPVLAEGRVFVATTPNFANPNTIATNSAGNPDAGHVYILEPGALAISL
jgi:outer membrane protein assembly factor BamB